MLYLVNGEIMEELQQAGGMKLPEEAALYFQHVVKPSLEALRKLVEERKAVGGLLAGGRECALVLDVDSNEEAGKILRSLPLWRGSRWTVYPLESFQSVVDQYGESNEPMRPIAVPAER